MGVGQDSILDKAKKIVDAMKAENKQSRKLEIKVTTSQLRNFLSEVVKISNQIEVLEAKRLRGKESGDDLDTLPQDIKDAIDGIDVKLIYAAGRDRVVGSFYKKSNIYEEIQKAKEGIKAYKKFAALMEAVVAVHKYNGGRD
ncbi:MAG: type III-A CRISPR-associated protein Csm2 [Veillonellaceae bacterium]|nr:type III-A CRISPR-associated protein Csm2 [Veillonellaceae bacterium]